MLAGVETSAGIEIVGDMHHREGHRLAAQQPAVCCKGHWPMRADSSECACAQSRKLLGRVFLKQPPTGVAFGAVVPGVATEAQAQPDGSALVSKKRKQALR